MCFNVYWFISFHIYDNSYSNIYVLTRFHINETATI